MLDLALFAFLLFFLAMGLRRPYIWVLAYLYIDILAPGKIGWNVMQMFPVSLIAFCAAFGGWLVADPKRGSAFTFRQGLLLALLLWCAYTTTNADFPEAAAEKWAWVWKALVFAIFLPLTLRTKLRIEAAALIGVLTAGAIIISAGIKTVTGGGGYGNLYFFVNDNSGLYESSTLATVAIAIVPLIIWLMNHGTVFRPDWRVKLFGGALIFACLVLPIGTEARTGLLCIAVLALMMLRYVKRRMLFIFAGGVLGLAALPFVPQTYYERMATIGSPQGDESASTRVAVWKWTLDYASNNPLGGGFAAYRGNKFTYDMPIKETSGNTTAIEYREVTDEGRAFHSAVFEMLGEQGYPGLILWVWLHLLGLWHMEVLRRRWRDRTKPQQAWIVPLATALQMGQVIYIVGALFQGIAFQPFMYMLVGLQCALWSYCKQADSQAKQADLRARRDRARAKAAGQQALGAQQAGDAVTAGSPALR